MRRLILALAVSLIALPAAAQESAVRALSADFDAFIRGADPLTAATAGDAEAQTRLPDPSPAADAKRKAWLEDIRRRLAAVDRSGLSAEDALNLDVLAWIVEERLQSLAFDDARMPFNSDWGFDQELGYAASSLALDSEADARAWIARLKGLPAYYDASIANARRGVRTRFTQPRATMEQVLARARAGAATPVDADPLLAPFANARNIAPERLAALKAEAAAALRDEIQPARRRFVTFLEREYLPASRPSLAIRSVPGGEAYYRWLVRDNTTTDLTPDQVHALGVSEVARIRGEMETVMRDAGFTGSLQDFNALLRKDPRFYATSRQDLLEKASEIAKRIDDKLPRYFATLPRLTYGVRPVPAEIEETYTTGRYFQGSPELGVAGGYMVNTSHLDQRPLYELPALTLHEAVPGHHLQIALAQELRGLPAFRRNAYFNAFGEGWGLYSEGLGEEMGIYRDPYERYGRLSYEMWRACRLVADTGIHWLGWSLPKARECFEQNTALSPLNIDVELARYVSWPGQALAYKAGELKFLELRRKAEAALGPKFDLRRFHDALLSEGSLPLFLLDRRIDAWIAAEKARPQ